MEYIRVGIEIVLLVLYVIYFGINSVNKYLNSGVIITRDEEPSSNISPPGIAVINKHWETMPEVINVIMYRAIPQYPGHLHREILIFSQKSLRTICTYHLVPFKLPKNVKRCPFRGFLVLKNFFQKISNFTNYALSPSF